MSRVNRRQMIDRAIEDMLVAHVRGGLFRATLRCPDCGQELWADGTGREVFFTCTCGFGVGVMFEQRLDEMEEEA